jgi:aspartyl-tRNA(Asn)/glutamyl-tRNA(Gln) amidotransferase subunit A
MYLTDLYTVPVNICGLPAISVPSGRDDGGMPIGHQLIGNKFDDDKLLSLAHFFENGGRHA